MKTKEVKPTCKRGSKDESVWFDQEVDNASDEENDERQPVSR